MKHLYTVDFYNEFNNEASGTPTHGYYGVDYLLRLVDEAPTWDAVVLEDEYTPRDIILSLADWRNIDATKFDSFEDLQNAIEDDLRKAGAFE